MLDSTNIQLFLSKNSLIFTVCGTEQVFSWSLVFGFFVWGFFLVCLFLSVQTLDGLNRDVSLDEAFHFCVCLWPCLTSHPSENTHTQSNHVLPILISSPSYCFLSCFLMYWHYIRLGNQVVSGAGQIVAPSGETFGLHYVRGEWPWHVMGE